MSRQESGHPDESETGKRFGKKKKKGQKEYAVFMRRLIDGSHLDEVLRPKGKWMKLKRFIKEEDARVYLRKEINFYKSIGQSYVRQGRAYHCELQIIHEGRMDEDNRIVDHHVIHLVPPASPAL